MDLSSVLSPVTVELLRVCVNNQCNMLIKIFPLNKTKVPGSIRVVVNKMAGLPVTVSLLILCAFNDLSTKKSGFPMYHSSMHIAQMFQFFFPHANDQLR
jgi:hypothetical protein